MINNDLYFLRKIKKNDEAAFKIVYNQFYSRLYYFIFEFIHINEITEDIVQDTFVTFWNKRFELKDNTNISAYLYTVAKNNCLYKLRDQRYRLKLFASSSIDQKELDYNLDALSCMKTSVFSFQEINQIIEQTLEGLPPQCRKVFTLSRFEEKKNREIAEELNISVKAVEGHITKGLKIFKIALKDYLPLLAFLFVP
jgi:RNA polymerase sigma-70 factor (ECF subfamily)